MIHGLGMSAKFPPSYILDDERDVSLKMGAMSVICGTWEQADKSYRGSPERKSFS